MTSFQLVGLALVCLLYAGAGVMLRFYAVRHWSGQRAVLWRQASGTVLLFGCAALFRFVFAPPWDGLWLIPILSLESLVIVLLLEREKILEYEPWNGISESGNLRHPTLHMIEDMMGIADRASDHQKELQRDLIMWKLMNQALRALEPTKSLGEWERMVDEVLEGMRGEDWPGR